MTAVSIAIDYDVSRWLMIPPPPLSITDWAARNATYWATETGRADNTGWTELFDTMLLASARTDDPERWDARMVHVLTPTGEGPSLALLNLLMSAPGGPPETTVQTLANVDDATLVRPPEFDHFDVAGIPATAIRRFTNTDAGVLLTLYVTWRAHEQADLIWTTSSYDLGRVLAMQPDAITLAQVTALVPSDEDAQ